jgi:hypothetical protein
LAKINVDVAVSRSEDIRVAAAFCRDSLGTYQGASVIVFNGITEPSVLETLVCREALALVEDLGLTRIYIASDGKSSVSDIATGSWGKYGAIISEIKDWSSTFQDFSFVHEGRASNFEAHNLARFTTSLGVGCHVWLGNPYDINIPVNIVVE